MFSVASRFEAATGCSPWINQGGIVSALLCSAGRMPVFGGTASELEIRPLLIQPARLPPPVASAKGCG